MKNFKFHESTAYVNKLIVSGSTSSKFAVAAVNVELAVIAMCINMWTRDLYSMVMKSERSN